MKLVNKILKFEDKSSFFYTSGLIVAISLGFHFWFTDQGNLIFGSVMGLATSCYIGLGYLFLAPSKDASEREIAIKNGLSIVICISMVAWLILKVYWGIYQKNT